MKDMALQGLTTKVNCHRGAVVYRLPQGLGVQILPLKNLSC